MNLKNKRVFLTGASQGIGFSIAKHLIKEGAIVFLTAIPSEQELIEVCKEIDPDRQNTFYSVMDVSIESQVVQVVEKAEREMGRIDILINNAGIAFQDFVLDSNLNRMKREFDVNYFGTYFVTQMVLKRMLPKKEGLIVNTGSFLAKLPGPTQANYSASKSAVLAFSSALRGEVEDLGIKVKVFIPGLTETNLMKSLNIASPRLMKPDEVAKMMIQFLKNENVEYVCGIFNRIIINTGRFFPEFVRRILKCYILKAYKNAEQ
ncbi:SDR family NAD(P)-dependent oxidoreductase [Leptospira bouyouniensis]|uniref:SDR family oxidoreductase n=1 Tax=Leptospira bouyouniensis TaxID=2484911 RepID=A0ABY2L055_9LEPT|nr:SDR family oxidoreductase [Leptospira bouyouniensis]TGK46667.1 SDR family oxidoreductase [Leptospira bouyouniensis]TGM79769.1 SDR family oxidoreductase [Leptospira bouyouniensis]